MASTLVAAATAEPIDAFPADPSGVVIQDRLYDTFEIGGKSFEIYAVIYAKGEGDSFVDIYSGDPGVTGMDWKKLHTWPIPKGPNDINVLNSTESEGHIQFISTSWFIYDEGRALPVLDYNPKTGAFEESLVD